MKLSNVHSKYGAPMGRGGETIERFVAMNGGYGKTSLVFIPLNQGGYDSGGAYWGAGESLYRASFLLSDGCETIECFFRAYDRKSAKAKLAGCKFYR